MDFKQPQVGHRQPRNKKHCRNAPPEAQARAAKGKQVPSAGAQSHVPLLQSLCSTPGPASAQGAARTLSGQWSVLAAESGEGAWASYEESGDVGHPLEPCRGKNYTEQELSQEEGNRIPKLSQGENNSNKTSTPENWRFITIRSVWVNPEYPELWREPLQEEAKAAAPCASAERVAAAGAQSPSPDSPCCSPCSSRTRLAAQTLREPQGARGRPSSPRRALRALCTLLWCSCTEVPLH